MPIVAVVNRKGGSGKTTLAGNLAGALAGRPAVLVIDADPQGSLSSWLGNYDGLTVTHAATESALEYALAQAKSGNVLAFVDCPPYDARLTAATIQAADLVLVPIAPSPLDLRAAAPLLAGLVQGEKQGLVVLNHARARTRAVETARKAVRQFGVPLARTVIGFRVAYVEAVAAGLPVTKHAPRSKAAEEIEALAREITRRIRR